MEKSIVCQFATEEQFQVACFQWWTNSHQFKKYEQTLFHVNNNSHNRIAGNINRNRGVKAGVSDFIFVGLLFVAFIELKLPHGSQHYEQITFQNKVEELGHEYYIVTTMEQFQSLIFTLVKRSYG